MAASLPPPTLAAYERKLRPVYDSLDARSYKVSAMQMPASSARCLAQPPPPAAAAAATAASAASPASPPRPAAQQAVKLADAVLKKYKSDQLVRALKGYALYRSGKGVEALQVPRG